MPEPPGEPVCSFCGKGRDQVGALISGPHVYICDECVDRYDEMIEKEHEPPTDDQRSPPRAMFNLAADCALCHLPTPIRELLAVPERGFLCAVCLEAIRLAEDAPSTPS